MLSIVRVLAVGLIAIPLAAQPVSESLTVNVLEIDVAVMERDGSSVEGLERDDFEVRVDGKLAELTNFFAVRRGAIVQQQEDSDAAAAAAPVPVVPTRILIFVDERHLRQRSLHYAIEGLRKYIGETRLDGPVSFMLMRWNGSLEIVQRPTRDRDVLLSHLDSMKRRPTGMEREMRDEAAARRTSRTFSRDGARQFRLRHAETVLRENIHTVNALRNVVRVAAGMGGRKILLYVSEGLAWTAIHDMFMGYQIRQADLYYTIQGSDAMEAQRLSIDSDLRILAKEAQSAGVAISTLHAAGVANVHDRNYMDNVRTSVNLLASQTGGTVVGDRNDLSGALALLTEQMSSYYSLGIRAPERDTARLQVKVRNRPQLRVVHSPRKQLHSREQALADAVRSRLYLREEQNPLGASIGLVKPAVEEGRCTAILRFAVLPERVAFTPSAKLSFHFAIVDENDNQSEVKSISREYAAGTPPAEVVVITVQPQKYAASFAVVDEIAGTTSYLQRDIDATTCR